jgi:hypothetical protein
LVWVEGIASAMNRALLAPALVALLAACGGTAGHKPCSASTCSTGCCDANDQCQPGNVPLACGEFGLSCRACAIGQTCSLGACTNLGAGGGTAQGGGTGFGGGTTSGGGTGFGGGTTSGGGTGFGGGTTSGGGTGFGGGTTSGGGGGTSVLPGDTCGNAERITLGQTLAGSLTGYADDYTSASCFNAFGADHVYTFTLTSSTAVRATVSNSSFSPAVSVRGPTTASVCGSASEPACNDSSNPAVATTSLLSPGTYFLMVESTDGTTGSYSVKLETFTAPAGDSCLSPLTLNLASGSAAATGTTSGATNDAPSGSCSATGGDIAYVFSVTSGVFLSATVTPSSSFYQPTLILEGPDNGCSNTTEITCSTAFSQGSSTSLSQVSLSPGTYTLWVSSASSSTTGSYSLSVTTSSSGTGGGAGGGGGSGGGIGTCTSPTPITVPTNTTVFGSTVTGGSSAGSSGCGGGLTEQIYSFTLTGTHTVTATATSQTSTFEPVLSYRSSCLGTELYCSAGTSLGGTATLSSSLSAGTYYLWVDSYNNGAGSTAGSFSLSVAVQ